jgi:hypothetical protein
LIVELCNAAVSPFDRVGDYMCGRNQQAAAANKEASSEAAQGLLARCVRDYRNNALGQQEADCSEKRTLNHELIRDREEIA